MQNVQNIQIQPMWVYVGSDVKQKQTITCRADNSGDLFGKYILVHSPTSNHVLYLSDSELESGFEVPTGISTAFGTPTRVAIGENASGSAIATALAAALTAISPSTFTATSLGKVVTLTNVANGYAHPARDAKPEDKKTGFAFKVLELGFSEVSIGAIDGDIELSGLEQSVKDITTHATGETAQGQIVSGLSNPSLGLTLQEAHHDGIRRALIMIGGQTMLPEAVDASEVVGYGTNTLGSQKPQFKVRLHPVSDDAAEKSGEYVFWKVAFSLESLTFSGTEFTKIPLEGSIFPDSTKPKMLQFFAKGDQAYI